MNIKSLTTIVCFSLLSIGTVMTGCDKKEGAQGALSGESKISPKWLPKLPEDVSIEVARNDSNFTLSRKGIDWVVESELFGTQAYPLKEEIEKELNTLFSKAIDRVTQDESLENLQKFRLDSSSRKKIAIKSTAFPEPMVFWLGKTESDAISGDKTTYVLSKDEKHLFKVKSGIGQFMEKSSLSMIETKIFQADPDDLTKIESVSEGEPIYTLVKGEKEVGKWTNSVQPDAELDNKVLDDMTTTLASISVEEFVFPTTDFSQIPVDKKRLFRITTRDGKIFSLLAARMERNGENITYVKEKDGRLFLRFADKYLNYIFMTSADLRERKSRPLELDEVKEYRFPGATPIVLDANPNPTDGMSMWRLTSPGTGGPLSKEHEKKTIGVLSTLKPKRMVDASLEETGLYPADPANTLEVRMKNGKRLQLVFGKRTRRKDGYYAVWQDNTDVFVVSNDDYKSIHPAANDLVKGGTTIIPNTPEGETAKPAGTLPPTKAAAQPTTAQPASEQPVAGPVLDVQAEKPANNQ